MDLLLPWSYVVRLPPEAFGVVLTHLSVIDDALGLHTVEWQSDISLSVYSFVEAASIPGVLAATFVFTCYLHDLANTNQDTPPPPPHTHDTPLSGATPSPLLSAPLLPTEIA